MIIIWIQTVSASDKENAHKLVCEIVRWHALLVLNNICVSTLIAYYSRFSVSNLLNVISSILAALFFRLSHVLVKMLNTRIFEIPIQIMHRQFRLIKASYAIATLPTV